MAELLSKLFHYGEVEISTNASGNGTATVTFPTSFDNPPEVNVIGSRYDRGGKYGAKNSQEMILAKGRQPMGSISLYADGGTGYTICTDDNSVASFSILSFVDNGDGKIVVTTDGAHGLDAYTVINIYDGLAAASINGFFVIEQVPSTTTFVIDREFVATGAVTLQVLAHDLEDDDLITVFASTDYAGDRTVSSSAVGTFKINATFDSADTKGYWVLKPTCTTTAMTVEVVNSDVRGGTVKAIWFAIEK